MAQASTIFTILGTLTTVLTAARVTAQSTSRSPVAGHISIGMAAPSTRSGDPQPGMHARTPTLYLSCAPNGIRTIPLVIYNDDQAHVRTGSILVSPSDASWLTVTDARFNLGYQLDLETYQVTTVQVDGHALPPGRTDAYLTIASDDPLNPAVPVHVVVYMQEGLPLQAVNCVLEESTGTWCAECPDGTRWLEDVKQQFGDRAIILSYHGYDTLTIPEGQTVLSQELGFTAYPLMTVMRRLDPRFNRIYYISDWTTPVGTELTRRPYAAAALDVLAYDFDPVRRHVSATLSITSNDPLPLPHDTIVAVTTYLVEDSLITPQREYIGGGQFVNHDAYAQRNVVRMIWPDRFGLRVPFDAERVEGDDLVPPGATATLRIDFDATGIADPMKTKIVFIADLVDAVGRGNTAVQHLGEILQGIAMPLGTGAGASVEDVAGPDRAALAGEIHPNPARSEATITLRLDRPEEVELRLIDMRGDEVRRLRLGGLDAGIHQMRLPLDGLADGIYAVSVRTGAARSTQRLVLTR